MKIRIKIIPEWSTDPGIGGWIDRDVTQNYLSFRMAEDEQKLKLLVPAGYKVIEYRKGAFKDLIPLGEKTWA